jgi:parallel beta-helix repeat protein
LANSPYIVVESVDVWEDVTLTIEPGVMVRFDREKKLEVNGELIVQGTENNLVTFTSKQPDPAPGDWGSIEFASTAITTTVDAEGDYVSGSILRYCLVEYGGYDAYGAIDAHSLLIDSCEVRNSSSSGIYATGTEVAPSWVVDNTVIDNSGSGIVVRRSTARGNTVTGNRGGGIGVTGGVATDNTVVGNSRQGFGGGIYADESVVSGNTVRSNSVTGFGNGGGISARYGSTVTGNMVDGNVASNSGGGIYASKSTLVGNIVTSNSATKSLGQCDGGGIYAVSTGVLSNTIAFNTIHDSRSNGAGVYVEGEHPFEYNTVVGNRGPTDATIGAIEIFDSPQMHYNNIYGNEPYDVIVRASGIYGSSDVSATHNYWGTVSSVDILAQVYDWYDDDDRGKVLYIPYLQEPSPDAPFPPPKGLTLSGDGEAVTLSWDGLPSFTTGYGYKVYYDTDGPHPPFDDTGLNEGSSPIDVADQTEYVLTGLDPSKDYYFGVTAYDNQGRESWYSNVAWKKGGYWVYLPAVLRE